MMIVSLQALAKDLPWKLKESLVLEIVQAVSMNLVSSEYLRNSKEKKMELSLEFVDGSLLIFPIVVISMFSDV